MAERINYEEELQKKQMEILRLQSEKFALDLLRDHETREREKRELEKREANARQLLSPVVPEAIRIKTTPFSILPPFQTDVATGLNSGGTPLQMDQPTTRLSNPPPPQPPPAPSRLGKGLIVKTAFLQYTLGGQIDQGGNARVFSAVDENGNPVAIKFLDNRKHLKRFENEVHFCEQKRHPNIIHVLGYGLKELKDGEHPFCVMPLYEKSLKKRLKEGLLPQQTIRIFVGLLSGMAEAHAQGIVHRDLKPANILFAKDSDEPVIADFGIAQFPPELMATSVSTEEGELVANRDYAAPEQTRGDPVGPQADMFALGLVLNEMFTGLIPKAKGFKTIRDANPRYGYLDTLFDALFIQDPARRLPSADVGLIELERLAIEAKDDETVRCIRNHNANVRQPVPFGDSLGKKESVRIVSKTGEYCSPRKKGSFTFDYSNNDGEFVIGDGEKTFRTRWSKASDSAIYAYKDGKGIDSIALLKNVVDIESIRKIEGDFSSRCRTPRIGDAIVWKNGKGYYAITKIVSIKDDTRGSDHDELTCEYVIFE